MPDLSTASITERLASLGSERWAVHFEARRRVAAGEKLIELTIGEPDVPTPPALIDVAANAMRAGRTRYAGGQGEPALLEVIAQKYAKRTGRNITSHNILSLPGTQAALAISMLTLVEADDAVMVPDPYYATYEGVVRATGADFVPVPMSAENGFHLTPDQLEAALVPNAKVLLLNSPHNPTGAVLTADEIADIGAVCAKHDLWILSDEVYEALIFEGTFSSPFDNGALADRTVAVSSISKSHAAPGFRAGWAAGPDWFIKRAQSVAETFLFGNQPFIADMTAHAVAYVDDTADQMVATYSKRASVLLEAFEKTNRLKALEPRSGMFMLVDVGATGKNGEAFAMGLLDRGVAVMPGTSFGSQAENFIRLSLTVPDERLAEAAARIISYTEEL